MRSINRSPSYLVRNPYSYCFRMRVPRDLQNIVGKKELRYSLKTGYIGIANQKARYLAGQVQQIFRFLRKGGTALSKLSDDQIKTLVEQHIKDSLAEWDRSFYKESNQYDYPLPFADAPTFYSYLNDLDDIREELIVNLNLGDFHMLENTVASIIKKNRIDDLDKQSTLYRKLCAEIHKAEIKLIPIQKRHMTCDFSYKNELHDVFPDIFPRISAGSQVTDEQESETLERVFEAFHHNDQRGKLGRLNQKIPQIH